MRQTTFLAVCALLAGCVAPAGEPSLPAPGQGADGFRLVALTGTVEPLSPDGGMAVVGSCSAIAPFELDAQTRRLLVGPSVAFAPGEARLAVALSLLQLHVGGDPPCRRDTRLVHAAGAAVWANLTLPLFALSKLVTFDGVVRLDGEPLPAAGSLALTLLQSTTGPDGAQIHARARLEARDLGVWPWEAIVRQPGDAVATARNAVRLPIPPGEAGHRPFAASNATVTVLEVGGTVHGTGTPVQARPAGAHCDPLPLTSALVPAARELWVSGAAAAFDPDGAVVVWTHVASDDPAATPGCAGPGTLRQLATLGRLEHRHGAFTASWNVTHQGGSILVDGWPVNETAQLRRHGAYEGTSSAAGVSYEVDVWLRVLGDWPVARVHEAGYASGFGAYIPSIPGSQAHWTRLTG